MEDTNTTPETTPAPEEKAAPAPAAKLLGMDTVKPGFTVRVHERIKDVNAKGEERERVQIFEGLVLSVRGSGPSQTFTVRKVSNSYGVEKIYPVNSPAVSKIEFVRAAKVRRAKLTFLTDRKKRFRRQLKEVKTPAKKA